MSEEQPKAQEKKMMDPGAEKAAVDSAEGRSGEGRGRGRRRRKVSYLTINKIETVDYKRIDILRRFLTERGKILPSRQTGNTAKQQRMISSAIKQAREMALLPFVNRDIPDDTGPRRRERRSEHMAERQAAAQQAPEAAAAE